MRVAAKLMFLALGFASPAVGQDAPKNPPRPLVRPAQPPTSATPRLPARIDGRVYVGQRAPDFILDGSGGVPVRLASRRGGWLLLLFAGDRAPLGRQGALDAEMKPLHVSTLGVCAEKARTLESLAARDSLPILWLADVTGEVSALYGFYDFGSSRILPGFVLMDPQGIVRLSLVGQAVPPEDLTKLVRFAVTGLD